MSEPVLAWHFVGATLRDGTPIPADGVKLTHKGEIVPCETGLHASERLLDALSFAPGETLCRVECGGRMKHQADKLVCSQRTILWRIDASELLREFARRCALDVAHLWDAPEIVLNYLRTGNEEIRAAARDAARAAAGAAAGAAALDAAGAAAWAAAWDAAGDAAWGAALAAAWDAAGDAAWGAALDAAGAAQNDLLTKMVMAAHEGAAA